MDPKLNNFPVIKSLIDLGEFEITDDLPVERLGTTFTMAQQACWLSPDHFAIGRWDGSLSVFDKNLSATEGPLIVTAVSAPADQGIQMLGWVAPNLFVSSNDVSSMTVWRSDSGSFQDIEIDQMLRYDNDFGVANCSTAQLLGSTLFLVTGHENGHLLIWSADADGKNVTLVRAVDLIHDNPTNPWGLQHIRGVEWFASVSGSLQVATGSENGEICIVSIPDGNILSRTFYNQSAQRGINSISVYGQYLLVANCSVGQSDKNLWLYRIDASGTCIELLDSVNLLIDNSRKQAFNFDVGWAWHDGKPCFFAATEEGALWMGQLDDKNNIELIGYEKVAVADLGAAIAAGTGSVVYAAYNITSFDTEDKPAYLGDPNRVILE